jgi:hypothetical protein
MPPRTPWPRRAPTIGKSRQRPVNLTGFIPLVDLTGDPQFFPFGATVDERHRSMRARNWWHMSAKRVTGSCDRRRPVRSRGAPGSAGVHIHRVDSSGTPWRCAFTKPGPTPHQEQEVVTCEVLYVRSAPPRVHRGRSEFYIHVVSW